MKIIVIRYSIKCGIQLQSLDNLKTILVKSSCLLNFIALCIKSLLNKLHTPKVMVSNVSERNIFIKLPFLGSTLFQIQKKLRKLFRDKLMTCNSKIVFTLPVRVKSFFSFKNKLSKMLLLGLAYKYKCGGSNATYYRKTKRHSTVRICEHLGISNLTGKKVEIENNKLTVIQEHFLCCNYSPSFQDFSILTREGNDVKLKIMENLLIARD